MKFSCEKTLLCEAINNVLPAVSAKSTLVALEGILVHCKNGILRLTSYNLELGISKNISVNEEEEGAVILNASLLSNIVNKMPNGIVSINCDEKLLTVISCADVEFTILGIDAMEFPDIPSVENGTTFSLSSFLLRNMISQTLFAVAQNDQNPVHTGSLFDIADGVLNVVSVDGYRLAMRTEKINIEDTLKFVVPGKTLGEIVKLLSKLSAEDDEEQVEISVSSKHICFSAGGYVMVSRLLEGEFINYRNAIPKESLTNVVIETKPFLDSIGRASIIINERAKSHIRCTFLENEVKLFCETPLGKINDTVPASCDGPEVVIGFNNRYMADALKASECEKLKIEMNGPISPMKLVPLDDDSFLFLVLPVLLKS